MRGAALLVLAIAACGGAHRAAAEPGIAPRPFTAEELRRGLPVGTDIRYRIEEIDKPPVILHWHVVAADATTCTMASQVLSEDGKVLSDEGAKTNAFADLVKHA